MRIGDAVVQVEQDEEAQDDRWRRLGDEQPLPAGETIATSEALHDEPRERAADDAGNRIASHQQCHHSGAPLRWKPVGEIQDHAREKASLRDAKDGPGAIELPRCVHEGRKGGNETPYHKHPANPAPGADFVQDDVARNLEQEVTDEENAGPESIDRVAKM